MTGRDECVAAVVPGPASTSSGFPLPPDFPRQLGRGEPGALHEAAARIGCRRPACSTRVLGREQDGRVIVREAGRHGGSLP
jgi:hypothetical protein